MNTSDLLVALGTISWMAYFLSLWWVGHEEQIRPTRGISARTRAAPGWLRWVCGVPTAVPDVSIPMALAQVTAAASAIALVVAALFWPDYPFVWQAKTTDELLKLMCELAAVGLGPYLAARALLFLWSRRN